VKVAIIGPGRMGTLLAVATARAGMRVVAVAGGSPASRQHVGAAVAGVRLYDGVADAAAAADLVLVCVPDGAIETTVTELALAQAVGEGDRVVHVAGSLGLAPLRRAALAGASVAACHPAMTVPVGSRDPDLLVGVAWAVTARPDDRAWAEALVTDLGGDPFMVPEDRRALYHAGLAVGANAVGAAVATARRLLLAASIERPEAFLAPLIEASVANVLDRGAEALTGPVARGDVGTVAGHLDALARDVPELSAAYRALAQATLAPLRAALSEDVVAELDRLLADPEG
jgi:predicted short-subunit dehydrogenase-like oxidoreductase (DUF2520 family)